MIAVVADVHLENHRHFGGPLVDGLNDRARHIVKALKDAYAIAVAEKADRFVVLGDLFDTSKPSPPVVAAAMQALEGLVPVSLVLGNHDMNSKGELDNALAPFRHVTGIRVHTSMAVMRCGSEELILVPYQRGVAAEWLPDLLKTLPMSAVPRVLGIHMGLHDQVMRDQLVWVTSAKDAIDVDLLETLCKTHNIQTVLAGDWHGRGVWTKLDAASKTVRQMVQVGALVPTGWDNPGLEGYGTVGLVDRAGFRFKEVPGPRFVDGMPAEVAKLQAKGPANKLFVRAKVAPGAVADVTAQFAGVPCAGISVQPDRALAQAAAKAAAGAARSSETLVEALDGFVQNLTIPSGVDRAAVLARSRAYLGL